MPTLSGPDILPPRTLGASPVTVRRAALPKEPLVSRVVSWCRSWASELRTQLVDFVTQYRVLRVPLLNWGMILLYGIFLLRLTFQFTRLYARHALFTMMLTNLLLYGLADILAQTLRSVIAFKPEPESIHSPFFVKYILEKGRPRRVILDEEDDDLVELGVDPDVLLDGDPHQPVLPPRTPPEVFSLRRLALFSVWGFIISFFQSPWYAFLNSMYNEDNKFLSVLKRVMTDQLVFSPVSLACFLSYMAIVMEKGDGAAVFAKIKAVYLPTLAINYAVWPASQFLNFMVIPKPLQIPFSSTIGVFWNAYLSLKNAR